MNVKISIVVPCYKQAQYLDECLNTVLNQSLDNWECIIVNDGSPDNTEEVAKKWIDKDERFKYLKKENGGLSSARNAGITIAQGEWILPLDADDKIGKHYLELAAVKFKEDYDLIYCEAEYFDERNGVWFLPEFNLKNLAKDNCIFCSALFRKNLWEKYGGYDEDMRTALEDWEFWIRILKSGGNVHKLKYIGFFYRIKSQSMINGLPQEKKIPVIQYIEKKHLEFFVQELGTLHGLYSENLALKNKISVLESSLSAKRIKILNKVLGIIGR